MESNFCFFFFFLSKKPGRRLSRQNRIPAATGSRIPVTQRFPVRAGFPRVPLHPVHPPFVRPVLHARAGLLSRAAGPHAAAGQPHVRAILAGTGTELARRQRRGRVKTGHGKLLLRGVLQVVLHADRTIDSGHLALR